MTSRARLLIGTEFLNEGGVGRQIDYLVKGLDPQRFEVHLAVFRRRDLFFDELLGSPRVRTVLLDGGSGVGPGSWLAMARLCRRLRPDIVHLFGGKANHIGGLVSFLCPTPVLIFSVRSATASTVNDLVYRLLRNRPSLTIVNSEGIRRELVERSGYRPGSVEVQHNFLDTELFRPPTDDERARARQALGLEGRGLCLACVGRLAPQKNQLAALAAVSRLREQGGLPEGFLLLFVGRDFDRRYAASVRERRRALGLDEVCLFREPLRDIVTLYHAVDGVFQPSTYEGLSNVVIEAQACGLPAALSREGDNDLLVRDGETGISFSAGTPEGVTEGLHRLVRLAGSPAARGGLGERVRRETAERFSLHRGIRHLEETYARLLRRSPRRRA